MSDSTLFGKITQIYLYNNTYIQHANVITITKHFFPPTGFSQPVGLGTNMDSGVVSLQSEKPSSIADTQQPPMLATEAPITSKNPLDLSAGSGKRYTNAQICRA